MTLVKPYRQHLTSEADLLTTYEAKRAGFVSIALEKNRIGTPFVEQARSLQVAALQAKSPSDLLNIPDIQSGLLTASGISDKALPYFQDDAKVDAAKEFIRQYLEPAGAKFVEELVYRFLLIRGDTVGGMARNLAGMLAQRKFTRAILATLAISGKAYKWMDNQTGTWLSKPLEETEIELRLRALNWQNGYEERTLIYNVNVQAANAKNVDICLLNISASKVVRKQRSKSVGESSETYIALGELKGGIDPAGADEHWKTASTALKRIRDGFAKLSLSPQTFFVGAAIERAMAIEIWNQLEDGSLSNAANLTSDMQVASLSRWLCNL